MPDDESRTTAVDYLRQASDFASESVEEFTDNHLSDLAEAIHVIDATGTDLDRIERVWQLMRRHGENVRKALKQARDLYDDPLKPLEAGSVLRLVADREHLRPAVARLAQAIWQIVDGATGQLFRISGPTDENDLNGKLAALIGSHHELTSEHPSVQFACARVTPDHTLVSASLLIEAKFIRKGTTPAKASEGMAADLVKFPSGSHILFIVYDPNHRIADDVTFATDFESRGRCTVKIMR